PEEQQAEQQCQQAMPELEAGVDDPALPGAVQRWKPILDGLAGQFAENEAVTQARARLTEQETALQARCAEGVQTAAGQISGLPDAPGSWAQARQLFDGAEVQRWMTNFPQHAAVEALRGAQAAKEAKLVEARDAACGQARQMIEAVSDEVEGGEAQVEQAF